MLVTSLPQRVAKVLTCNKYFINGLHNGSGQKLFCELDFLTNNQKSLPMDTSSSIRHRFDVEIPRGKFVEITSILKGESMWKL